MKTPIPAELPLLPNLPDGYSEWEYFPPLTPCHGEMAYGTANRNKEGFHEWVDVGPLLEGFKGCEGIHYIFARKPLVNEKSADSETPNLSSWQSIQDQPPTESDYPIWTYTYNDILPVLHNNNKFVKGDVWMRAEIPVVPVREMTQVERDEEAYKSWVEADGGIGEIDYHGACTVWHAALIYARGGNEK